MIGRPTIAVIIPTYYREHFLLSLLRQLREQVPPPQEIITVDQTPPGGYSSNGQRQLETLEKEGRIRRLILSSPAENRARNAAAAIAESEVLLFLDDDVELPPGFVGCHAANYRDVEVAAVTGRIIGAAGEIVETLPPNYEALSLPDQAFSLPSGYTHRLERTGRAYGGNFSVRSTVLRAIGGWNERLTIHTDLDLGLRLAEAGYRIVYDPAAWLKHLEAPHGGERTAASWRPLASRQRAASAAYFAFRYPQGSQLRRWALRMAARHTVLRRQNLMRPWRLPAETLSLVCGIGLAWRWSRK
ncbi:MAG: glycosyltransferase family 2 protein [Candidatus Zipacnadales bacterium]